MIGLTRFGGCSIPCPTSALIELELSALGEVKRYVSAAWISTANRLVILA
jgi:hypothetical protein